MTTYDRDGLGRVRAVTHPDAGRTAIERIDDAGNAIKRTDARGATVVTTYDGITARSRRRSPAPSGTVEETVTYHYDSPSPRFPDDRFAPGS